MHVQFSESQDTMLLLVYNPSSIKTYYHVRLPAIAMHYSIRDYNGKQNLTNSKPTNYILLASICYSFYHFHS